MADPDEIHRLREAWAKRSDAELLNEVHSNLPSAAMSIAARQMLAERQAKKEDERHREIQRRLDDLKRPHWTVKPTFWIAVISAIAAIVAAYFAWRPQPPVVQPPPPEAPAPKASSPQKPPPLQSPPKP